MSAQPTQNGMTYVARAEEEQQTLTAVIESSSDFIGIATPAGQVLYVNQAGQDLVGWEGSAAELRSLTFYDFHPEEDATFMHERFVEGLRRNERWEGEWRRSGVFPCGLLVEKRKFAYLG